MRLNQYIAHNTQYSRREADRLIQEGRISINKEIIKNFSLDITDQKVYLDGKKIKNKNDYEVIVYNKPKGEIVSKSDDRGRSIIYDTLPKRFKNFTYIGRLDYASEGLLLLTDNPKIATLLMESKLERTYILKLSGKINTSVCEAMENGLTLENAQAGAHKNNKIDKMDFAPFIAYNIIKNDKYSKIKVTINEGQNRELRRFFAHFKLEVLDLKRVSFGFVSLNNLPSKKVRFLTHQEYNKLREFLNQSSI
ncbi:MULTISPECIES: pseudouridine synthase [Helicobacter]|uniref:Pseudouridine synthase n=1 Tax=Helicobacter ibis TaxID=2962633 RepID=A0ABT4VD16_9HELI|nr:MULTISPECIES: pseudouridine synthase [Helicobacter]MDA3967335.1 pseudouridine synthase [Helicobacter sp. WB40]MDA3968596.1 pseudouridine synthase [Helicobacter ibis]